MTRLKAQRGKPSLRAIEARAKQLFGAKAALPIATQSAAFNGRHVNMDNLILMVRTLMSWDEYGEECIPPERRAPELDEWRTWWTAAVALRPRRRQPSAAVRPALATQVEEHRAPEPPLPPSTEVTSPYAAPIRIRDKYGLPVPADSRADYGVAFSPDEILLATCSADGRIQLWDTRSVRGGGELQPFRDPLIGHDGPVYGVAFSPEGRYLASCGADGTVRLWDAYTREPVGDPITGHKGAVYTVGFWGSGTRVFTGGADGVVRQWDTYTLAPAGEALQGHGGPVMALAFPGAYLAVGAANGSVKLWDRPVGGPAETFFTEHGPVYTMASTAFTLAVGHANGATYLWDVRKPHTETTQISASGSAVYTLAHGTPNKSRALAAGSPDGTLRLWHQRHGEPTTLAEAPESHEGPIFAAAFSPEGSFLATGGADGEVALWHPTALDFLGAPGAAAREPSMPPLSLENDEPSPESSLAAKAVHYTLQRGHHVSLPPLVCGQGARAVAFSPDGRLLATGADDGAVQLWNPVTREPIGGRLTERGGMIRSLVFSPDSSLLAAVDAGKPVRMWDTATCKPVGDLSGVLTGSIRSVAFSPDSKVLVTGGDDSTVRLWDTATQDPVRLPLSGHGAKIVSVAFSSDGLLAAIEEARKVWLWELADDENDLSLFSNAGSSATAIAFSPNGSVLAVGGIRGEVCLWSADTLEHTEAEHPFTSIGGPVRALEFSPDACSLAVGGEDQTVWLTRDDGRNEPISIALTGHCDAVSGVAFSPDGSLLATASKDRTVRLWTVPVDGSATGRT
ncbi:WD40 repeat domain-containing protein [Streptomyces sp. NPDC001339]|uniref:WD40 repeat domain-containing protein n=1 Tax=Streptomyces sp. NPDC001339 TaxID=3364563 RepID=UPI003695AC67